MSQGLYLICHATQQEVHVMESGGFGVRGDDDSLVLAAFCEAHSFKHQLVVLGEERGDDDQYGYTLWTAENAEDQFRLVAGVDNQWSAAKFAKAFAEHRAGTD